MARHQDRWALEEPSRHPNYNLTPQKIPEYDFAVIKVNKDFILDEDVNIIELAKSHNDYNPKDCYATGFGKDKWGKIYRHTHTHIYIYIYIYIHRTIA